MIKTTHEAFQSAYQIWARLKALGPSPAVSDLGFLLGDAGGSLSTETWGIRSIGFRDWLRENSLLLSQGERETLQRAAAICHLATGQSNAMDTPFEEDRIQQEVRALFAKDSQRHYDWRPRIQPKKT